ncbi:MAG: J domain-containing protein [Enterocloster asparagiformis]|nr:J domain-containing protein [Enterocloster asparagiformis]
MKTYYDILQISKEASPEIIKAAYTTLIKKYHPDNNPAFPEECTEMIKRLNTAYEVLSDPSKRKVYDQQLYNQSAPPYASSPVSAPKIKSTHPFHHMVIFFLVVFFFYLCNLGLRSMRSNVLSNTDETEPQATISTVSDEALVEKQPPFHGRFLEGGEDITRNDLYYVDGYRGIYKYARLEIKMPKSKGNMYYLKFHCQSTGQTYIIFAHSGDVNINVNLLCGDYELTYAVGSKWYGKDHLFGTETRYYKCNSLFSFYHDGDVACGESLTLYQVPNGNLGIEEIDAADF